MEIKAPQINRIDRLTFPVRNIDAQEWWAFKYNANVRGFTSANDAMLYLIDRFNKESLEK